MRNLTHFQLFIHSLLYPTRLAACRVLTIGKVIQYTFLLITLMTIASFIQFLQDGFASITLYDEISSYMNGLEWLVYLLSIVLSFIINTLVLYAKISIYAYVGLIAGRFMQKRIEYRFVWRTAAFVITWNVLLQIIFIFIDLPNFIELLLPMLITLTYLYLALTKYPKIKK
jgi:hypothetical protein